MRTADLHRLSGAEPTIAAELAAASRQCRAELSEPRWSDTEIQGAAPGSLDDDRTELANGQTCSPAPHWLHAHRQWVTAACWLAAPAAVAGICLWARS